jgi:hypothetical protein
MQAFGVNVAPTAAVPIVEQMTNHSFFTGNPLIPRRLEGILPEYQAHEYTTQLSQAVGHVVGAFPGLHDKSIASPCGHRQLRARLDGQPGRVHDAGARRGAAQGRRAARSPAAARHARRHPVVKAFVIRYPAATAQSVQDFHEKYAERKKVYDTFQYLVKNGDPDAAIKEAELDPSAFARMEGVHETIGVLNATIRLVYKNPDMSPSDKRQLIDSMYGQMIEVARAGNAAMVGHG